MRNYGNSSLRWTSAAALGVVVAFAIVLGASGRSDARPENPIVCENDVWFSVGKAPTGCASGDPPVAITVTSSTVGRCPVNKCGAYAPIAGGFAAGTRYACKSAALAHNCAGTPTVGTVTPLYYIAALVYSPPGCTTTSAFKCGQTSTVSYQSGSSNGTQTSTQNSFQGGVKAEASFTVGTEATGALSAAVNVGFQGSSTNGASMTITKKQNQEIKTSGNQDGINHNQDQFILILHPLLTYSALDNEVKWTVGSYQDTAQYVVSVADLKNPALNPARMKTLLDLGFTASDFATILAQDPFANGPTAPDTDRFIATTWRNLPYETPDTGSDCNGGTCACLSVSGTMANDFAAANSTSAQQQYSVGLSVTAQSPKVWPVSVKATVSGSMTWTNTASSLNTTGSTQSATVTIQCPSPGYVGPQAMDVYWDTLYGSFVFAPHVFGGAGKKKATMHSGHVKTASGTSAKRERVDLTYGGRTYHTFTNKNGDYAFEDVPSGDAQLTVAGVRTTVKLGLPVKELQLRK